MQSNLTTPKINPYKELVIMLADYNQFQDSYPLLDEKFIVDLIKEVGNKKNTEIVNNKRFKFCVGYMNHQDCKFFYKLEQSATKNK